jgi:hypothetical protein
MNNNDIQRFKDFLVDSMNDDVYYQLKDWINNEPSLQDKDFETVVDYFMDNLHGGLVWQDS